MSFPSRFARRALPIAAVAAMAVASPASAARHPQFLLARTPSGGQPNAPAMDPAISGDGRVMRYAAYDSAATDIAANSGAHRNVYLVYRKRPFNFEGKDWHAAKTVLVSKGRGGQPADGDSWGPTIDGYDYTHGHEITVPPKCLAFISAATNLVPGDTNGHADVFLLHIKSGKLSRIATAGQASEVSLDGRCFALSYVANATVSRKAIRFGGKPRRISGPGGASSPQLSANAKMTVFSPSGYVYINRWGEGGTRRVTAGTNPTSDDWGRYVAFNRGSELWRAHLEGAAKPSRLHWEGAGRERSDGLSDLSGTSPDLTTGGDMVAFVDGANADSSIFERPNACPSGVASQIV